MKSRVVLIPCESYQPEALDAAVAEGFRLWGGPKGLVRPDETILFKANLLKRSRPEQAVVTHPALMESLAGYFREKGFCHLTYGDSPGVDSLKKVAADTGMAEAMERSGVACADFDHGVRVSFPEGQMARGFVLAKAVAEKPAVINVCKMKTHALERMTGAVKNMYGCVSGFNKAAGHTLYADADSFARMLVDLNRCVAPRFAIMDGITAMEGNGPGSGTPVDMNVLLMSDDFVALDSVCCHLMNVDPALVPTNIHGGRMGLGTWHPDEITVVTPEGEMSPMEAGARYGKADFDIYRGRQTRPFWRRLDKAMGIMKQRPYIDESRCIRCGICVEACPVEGKALRFPHGKKGKETPAYDYKKCIGCFCCQEMCPKQAIKVHTPRLRRIFDKAGRTRA